MEKEIYFDNSATTKISDAALEKYVDVSRRIYGNPSSLHGLGFLAEKEISATRDAVRTSLGAGSDTVVFTASGSEANNLAIIGRALSKERYRSNGKILTTMGEHASVGVPIELLSKLGFKVVYIPTRGGVIDTEALEKEMTPDVILVTMMMVNNETGALYDTLAVSKLMKIKSPNAVLHVDATQSYMKIPFTKSSCGADMITISSHKIEGPKGVGALVIDKGIIKARGIVPLTLGGGQEGGLRSGTENVPGIAAFGEAIRLALPKVRERYAELSELREYLIGKIESDAELREISVTNPAKHAPHIINLTLPHIKSETMLHFLSSYGIYVSSGSACSSNSAHVSSALLAFGRNEDEADSSVRISLSYKNTKAEIDRFIEVLKEGLAKLSRKK